jgi:putative FmdB family regulatory protein
MPIFEFKCCKCGKEFERIIFGSDEQVPACPDCGSPEASKMLSVFACTGLEAELASSCGKSSSGGFS